MGVFRQFPYSNFHEMNMDEIIKVVKDMLEEWAQYHAQWDEWQGDINQAWHDMQDFINDYFDNLDVQQEINNKIISMVNSGEFADIVSPYIPDEVTTWLAANITQPVGVVIDTSLTVAGACADAAATGEVKKDVEYVMNPEDDYNLVYCDNIPDNLIDLNDIIEGYYIDASGVQTASATWTCTPYIDVENYSKLYGYYIGLGAFYDSSKVFISSETIGNNDRSVPSGAKYFRCSIQPANLSNAVLTFHQFHRDFPADFPVHEWCIPKKGYEDGYIHFTVQVNNTVATYSNTSEVNNEGTPNYIDVNCILSLPFEYKPVGKPCKLLMMCHGAGRGVTGTDNWTEQSGYNTLVSFFNTYGYAVFDCNGFNNTAIGCSFWGNQRGVEAWRKAYKYVTDNYNVEKTFSIYAFSMGGLTAMNLALQGFPNIDAIAMGSPVLDLHKAWESTDGTQTVISTVYDMVTWDDAKVVGDNPYKHIIKINGVDYCPFNLPPIKIWYGSTETNNAGNPSVDKDIAKDFVDAITASGGYAYYREVSGRGHEICYGDSNVVNQEILYFIERYERSRATRY